MFSDAMPSFFENIQSAHSRVIEEELKEHHQYVRTNFQLLVAWFTFHCTLVLGAVAWSAKFATELESKQSAIVAYVMVGVFLALVTLLGLKACSYVAGDIRRIKERTAEIKGCLVGDGEEKGLRPASEVPGAIDKCIRLMQIALAGSILWQGILGIAIWCLPPDPISPTRVDLLLNDSGQTRQSQSVQEQKNDPTLFEPKPIFQPSPIWHPPMLMND